MIAESSSVLSAKDFVRRKDTPVTLRSRVREVAARSLPTISRNLKAATDFRRFSTLLTEGTSKPKALVVGGRIVGEGLDTILSDPRITFVETDVSFSPRTVLICDAHSLPFVDGAFDGVIAQAVLEHVLDPRRCVAEIHRVLGPRGVVYGEIPFMQQVHAGRFDFTRFTHLGVRRLFGVFEEIESGAVCGPGMALAWSYTCLLTSFAC